MSDMQPENIKSFQNAHSPFTGEEIESQPGIQHTEEAGPREAGENRYWLSWISGPMILNSKKWPRKNSSLRLWRKTTQKMGGRAENF